MSSVEVSFEKLDHVSAFWLKSSVGISSYQFNIWYVLYLRTMYYMDFWSREIKRELAPSVPCIDLVLRYPWEWCATSGTKKKKKNFWQSGSFIYLSWVLPVFVYLLKCWNFPHVYSCTISNCFWCGSLNLTIHLGLPYHNFSGYPQALSSGECNSSCACKCVRYLELTCPKIGPLCAVLSHIRKHL